MTYYLRILKDNSGDNYLGIDIDSESIEPFLNHLKGILGDSYEEYTNLQKKRDGGRYHITVMNVSEFNLVSKNMGFDKFTTHLQHILKVGFDDIKFLGLGMAEKSGNISYFIVTKSQLLDNCREMFQLDPKDFHITLGFRWKDVHGVPKNQILSTKSDFLSKLKSSYIKEGGTFEFIKGIKNFDCDFFKQIEPIKINETNAVFRCGKNDYIQVSLVDGQFYITAQWQDTNKLPILSNNLIEKKFKQIN